MRPCPPVCRGPNISTVGVLTWKHRWEMLNWILTLNCDFLWYWLIFFQFLFPHRLQLSETETPASSEGIRINLPTEVSTDDATVRSKRSGKEGDIHPAMNLVAAGNKRLWNDNDSSEINPPAVGSKRPRNDEERLPSTRSYYFRRCRWILWHTLKRTTPTCYCCVHTGKEDNRCWHQ